MLNAQLAMLASIFCFSLAGYFSSLLAVQVLAFAMVIRFAIPTLVSLATIREVSSLLKNKPSMLFLCFVRGAVIFLSQYLLYITINKIGLASGLILYNFGPIFLIMLFTLLGNKLKVHYIVLIAFSFIGGLVFFKFDLKLDDVGIILGISAALFYATSQYINANMAKDGSDPKLIILLVNLSGTVISALYLSLVIKPELSFHSFEISSCLVIIAMGLATYGNQYLRIISFKMVKNPNTVIYLTYFGLPFSLFFMFLNGEFIEFNHVLGSIIILSGGIGQFYLHCRITNEPQHAAAAC